MNTLLHFLAIHQCMYVIKIDTLPLIITYIRFESSLSRDFVSDIKLLILLALICNASD